jgi:1,4-dihydroxy-2-naphthoyl-CoA synthase
MGYRVDNWGYILGGETIFVAYTLAGASDQGAQFAQAMPQIGPYDVGLVSYDHTTEWAQSILKFTYYFWVRSENGASCQFHLSGGGVQ